MRDTPHEPRRTTAETRRVNDEFDVRGSGAATRPASASDGAAIPTTTPTGTADEREPETTGGAASVNDEREPETRVTGVTGPAGGSEAYDLHTHTDASPCSDMRPSALVEAAVEAGVSGIAVTDHDTTAAVDAVTAAAPPSLTVVPGVEVTTPVGHLLALGVERPPPDRAVPAAVDWVHERGGVAVLAHPFDRLRQSYDDALGRAAAAADAVESVNSRCLREAYNGRARRFADRESLPTTGGSDAHFPHEVGRAVTRCDGDPLAAIRRGETVARGRGRYVSGHVATKLHQFRERL